MQKNAKKWFKIEQNVKKYTNYTGVNIIKL